MRASNKRDRLGRVKTKLEEQQQEPEGPEVGRRRRKRIFFVYPKLGWRQDNRNRSNQESKFDFVATRVIRVAAEGEN